MSQIMTRAWIGIAIISLAVMLPACGTSTVNSDNVFNNEEKSHGAAAESVEGGEIAWHVTAANANVNSCKECHGQDLLGGISQVSCSQCHLGGANSVHPVDWGTLTMTKHAIYVVNSGNTSCANAWCHGTTLTGVAGSGPSCSSCHIGGVGSVHPLDWGTLTYYKHSVYVKANGNASCANALCHGPALAGVTGSGPSCTSCHLGGVNAVHPAAWDADMTLHKNYVAAVGSSSCQNAVCHGTQLQGVFLSGPACATCH
jgi:hypothetical protein